MKQDVFCEINNSIVNLDWHLFGAKYFESICSSFVGSKIKLFVRHEILMDYMILEVEVPIYELIHPNSERCSKGKCV